MESSHSNANPDFHQEPVNPHSAPAYEVPEDLDQFSVERIQEYRSSVLNDYDPLTACMGDLKAGLMEFSQQYRRLIRAAKAQSLDDLRKLAPHFECMLKMDRQVERLAQLEQRQNQQQQKVQRDRANMKRPK